MRVEVVYALATEQHCVVLQLEAGAVAREAVEASGLIAGDPGLAARDWSIGIGGKAAAPESALRDGDRVEILRPLAMDPKEARRRRARRGR